jgi:hypothetical protein
VKSNFWCGALALAVGFLCLDCSPAVAQQLPAVSAINGKFEFNAGALTLPALTFMARAAGAITVPLGQRFGLQADVSISSSPAFTTSGALHLFTRDPASYLIGGTLGFVHSPGATVFAAGPEAELYFDRWTIEAWAGASLVRPAPPVAPRLGPFILSSHNYYPSDNWRVSAGISSLDGYTAVQIGSEYLFEGLSLPLALTGEVRLGQDGALRVTTGIRGYLGPDSNKTLIDRQRQDDPADMSTALYTAAGKATIYDTPKPAAPTPTPSPAGPPPAGPSPSTPDPTQPTADVTVPDTTSSASTEPDTASSSSEVASNDASSSSEAPSAAEASSSEPQASASEPPSSSSQPATPASSSSSEVSSAPSTEPSASMPSSSSEPEASSSSVEASSSSPSEESSVASSSSSSSSASEEITPTSSSSSEQQQSSASEASSSSSQQIDPSSASSSSSIYVDPIPNPPVDRPEWCSLDAGDLWDGERCTSSGGFVIDPSSSSSAASSSAVDGAPDWCSADNGYHWDGTDCRDDSDIVVAPPYGDADVDPRSAQCLALGPGAEWHGDEDGGTCYNDGEIVILPDP